MKYNVRITVKNSGGNELVKIFNFTTVDNMEFPDMYRILYDLVKDGYFLKISEGHRKPNRKTPIPFEKLCTAIREWRFYETKMTAQYETKHLWKYETSLVFPCEVSVKYFHSEWGGTFFEIAFEEKSLVEASFDSVKAHLEKYHIDLHKSKTEGLWYSHKYLDLQCTTHTIIVGRRYSTTEWVSKTEKIEL